jgi:hypothetical protein
VFADEEVLFSGNSQGPLSGEIFIPPDAPEGNTRMRISMKWGGQPPSCGSFSYGEVEDYTVSIATEAAAALGEISSMAAGSDPEVVYAIDRDNRALYFISTSAQQIVETVTLPDAQPVAMAYSNPDNDLYIVSASSGAITVFDLDTSQTSPMRMIMPCLHRTAMAPWWSDSATILTTMRITHCISSRMLSIN